MNCPSCNAQVPPEATSCPGCGSPITPAPQDAASQDAQKKAGFDIKAASSQFGSNPVIKKYGVFIAAGVIVLLVLIICIASCGGGSNADMELVTGMGYIDLSRDTDMTGGSDKEKERLYNIGIEHIKKAAKQGNVEAMLVYAGHFASKEEDNAKALKWAEKAEKKGSKAGKEMAKALRKEKKEDAE